MRWLEFRFLWEVKSLIGYALLPSACGKEGRSVSCEKRFFVCKFPYLVFLRQYLIHDHGERYDGWDEWCLCERQKHSNVYQELQIREHLGRWEDLEARRRMRRGLSQPVACINIYLS